MLYLNLHSSKNQSQLSFEKYDDDLFLVIFFPNTPSDLFLVIPATFTQLEDPGVRQSPRQFGTSVRAFAVSLGVLK